MEDDQAGVESSYSISPLATTGGIALSDSEKAEALADRMDSQFQPVADPSAPAIIEAGDVALRSYFLSPASVPQVNTPDEVHEAIRCLKVSKAQGPICLPNRALEHLPKRTVSILARIFNAVVRTLNFLQRGSTHE